MKIVFLNIWGGKVYAPLMDFVRASAPDTDIFCLQEIFDTPERGRVVGWGGRADIWQDVRAALPGFESHHAVAVRDFDGDGPTGYPLALGNAICAKKSIAVLSQGDMIISGEHWQGPGTSEIFPHLLQYIRFEKDDTRYTVANVHGVAYPGHKRDTPDRIAQSEKIVEFLAGEAGVRILGGDFNLMPDTESIRMIEQTGMRNLIADFGIATTRSELSYAQYPPDDRQHFADFAFVSPEARVVDFRVPRVNISDHLPLVLSLA